MEGLIILNKQTKESLECPVCALFYTPPILECTNGHSICGPCSSKINYCPECRLQSLSSRNWSLERIISSIEMKCRFSGCTAVFLLSKRLIHEKFCEFSPNFECVIKGCEWEGSRIVEHMINIHKIKEFKIDSFCTVRGWNSKVWKNADWGYSIWNFDNTYIFNQSFSDKHFFYLYLFDISKRRHTLKLTLSEKSQKVEFIIQTASILCPERPLPLHLSIAEIEKNFLFPAEGFDLDYKRLSITIELLSI